MMRDLAGESHLVRDEDRGHAFLDQLADRRQHLLAHLRIERGGHLVEEHDLGPHGQSACDRDALLLSSRELARIAFFLPAETHLLEELVGSRLDLLFGLLQYIDRRHHHVLQRCPVRKQVVLLKHDRDVLAQRDHLGISVQSVNGMRSDENLPAIDRDQSVDAAEQRRLSRSRGADDTDGFSRADLERNAAEHLHGAEGLVDIGNTNDGAVAVDTFQFAHRVHVAGARSSPGTSITRGLCPVAARKRSRSACSITIVASLERGCACTAGASQSARSITNSTAPSRSFTSASRLTDPGVTPRCFASLSGEARPRLRAASTEPSASSSTARLCRTVTRM